MLMSEDIKRFLLNKGFISIATSEKVVMIKVKCEKITKISISGKLKIERIKE